MTCYVCEFGGEPGEISKEKQREYALFLLDYALLREYGATVGNCGGIVRNGNGKPRFANDCGIHFSYSHCPYGAACVVCGEEVGVDVEHAARKVSSATMRKVCTPEEAALIGADEDFIKIWVQKEAFAKFTGRGIAEGFAGIDSRKLPPPVRAGELLVACYSAGCKGFEVVQVPLGDSGRGSAPAPRWGTF